MIPQEISTSKILFLISAIINLLWAVLGAGYVFVAGLSTCGIGCFLFVIPAVNVVACIMEFIAYNKLNTLNRPGTYNSIQFAAILEIVDIITGNIVSLIFGIITLMNVNKESVKIFLQERNIY